MNQATNWSVEISKSILTEAKKIHIYLPSTLVDKYLNGRVSYNDLKNIVNDDRKIVPSEIFWVDPRTINRSISWTEPSDRGRYPEYEYFTKPKYKIAGTVRGGDWDKVERKITNGTVYNSFVNHFKDGLSWEETELYEEVVGLINQGERWWRCSSEREYEQRCEELDTLFEMIKSRGYKSQRELLLEKDVPLQGRGARNATPFQILKGEIAVNIGRNGDLIFQDGRDRLSMAKILDLDRIPVIVLVRHKKWQQLRNDIISGDLNQTSLPEELHSHPDLPQNIV